MKTFRIPRKLKKIYKKNIKTDERIYNSYKHLCYIITLSKNRRMQCISYPRFSCNLEELKQGMKLQDFIKKRLIYV